MRETGDLASEGLVGDKLYQRRARLALPVLIRQARATESISYGKLAEELGMPNPRNLNYVLGSIGNAMLDLSSEWNIEVPPIQALVLNQSTGLPGTGLAWFAKDASDFRTATTQRRRMVVDAMLDKVYAFNEWDRVLNHFNLTPSNVLLPTAPTHEIFDGLRGESEHHRELKQFVAQNPECIGLPRRCPPGEVEFLFRSADAVDVLFRNGREWVGAEVKSSISGVMDIARGLFQCAKYQALLEATMKVNQVPVDCRTVLVLETDLHSFSRLIFRTS